MPKYSFKAKNALNETIEGFRSAGSDQELVASLKGEGLFVFQIKTAKEELAQKGKTAKKKLKGGGVTQQDIAIFCRQLSTLINAGVSILDGIEDVSEMVSTARFQKILKGIAADVRGGSALSDALKKHQKIFGKVFISLIGSGEKSGQLGKTLVDLADYEEDSVKLKRQVKAASTYPAFIGVFFTGALGGLIFVLIPKFKAMFASFGAELPLPTRIVMAISDAAIHNIVWILLLLGGITTGIVSAYRTTAGRMFFDRMTLRLPVFGDMILKIVLARFFKTMATLIVSGTDIIASLDIAGKVADNLYIETIIVNIRNKIVEGSTLSEEMDKSEVFPKMVVRMTSVGEKSGQMDEMFDKISDYYSSEVDAMVTSMSSIIEPFLIVALGGIVGLFVVVMYLPIFKLAGAIMGGSN